MGKVYIIHGCASEKEKEMGPEARTYDKHWIPWIKEELEGVGIKTEIPLMPSPWAPVYESFKAEFEKYSVSQDDTLIGFSCGASFLVRWLGETKQRVRKLILVAPWKIPQKKKRGADLNFYTYPIDQGIRSRVGEIVMFTADDEKEEGKESLRIYHASLGGKIIELKGRGHYVMQDMGTVEFPELLEVILQED